MAYKILWYSIPALHDNTNGAAIHSKIMLEALARRGIEVKVLNALVGDDVRGLAIFNRITKNVPNAKQRKFFQFIDSGIEYFIANTKGHISNDITNGDQNIIFDLYVQLLDKYQPDLVMGYSGDVFSQYLRHEAHVRGISVAYALHNGLHRGFSFEDCDLVFTPSESSAQMYRELDGIDVKAVGQFIDKRRVLATRRHQKENIKFVTLVNPTPEKGMAIFTKLHEVFSKKHPEIPFLVVKSVGNYPVLMNQLHLQDGSKYLVGDKATIAEQIKVAEHTDDPRLIYDISRVIVMPSVWHEAWGCVATEAVMNGIPVLASKSGGLPEAVREGGILLDAPECTRRDYRCVPSDEEIAPWVEALERCLSEDWSERCAQASAENDIERSIDRLLSYIEPLMQRALLEKRPLDASAYFSPKTVARRKAAYAEQAMRQQAQAQQGQLARQQAEQAQQPVAPAGATATVQQGQSANVNIGATNEPLIDIEGYGKPKPVAAPVSVAQQALAQPPVPRVKVKGEVKANSNSSKKNRPGAKRKKK